MRVLHITRDYPPRSHGGLSSALPGWVRAGTTVGIRAAVVSFDAYRPGRGTQAKLREEPGQIPVLRIEGRPPDDAAVDFARRHAPDVLHLHHGMLLPLAAALREALRRPLIKSVHLLQRELLELRGLDHPNLSVLAQDAAVRAADLLTAPSPGAAARLCADYPELRAPPALLPLAIEMPEPAGSTPPRPTLLYAGRFADIKGVGDWLQALPKVARAVPEVQFTLAGGLPANPRGKRRFLRQHVDSLPEAVRARVQVAGWCDPPALSRAYREAYALVAPSWSETFGQCVFEALAHGTPVIATRAGAFQDYLQSGREALLVPPRDPARLAAAAIELMRNPSLRAALARRAPAATERFHPLRIGANLLHLYREASTLG